MIENTDQLRATLEQMRLIISAMDSIREDVLTMDRKLVSVMAEGPIDQLEQMRQEALEFARQLPPFEVSQPVDVEPVESVS